MEFLTKNSDRPLMSLFIRRGRAKRSGGVAEVTRLEREIFGLTLAATELVRAFIDAMDVYEHVLSERNGRTTRATRTWMTVDKLGVLGVIEKMVQRTDVPMGFDALGAARSTHSFEAIVLSYPSHFSTAARQASAKSLAGP